jgi:hypothetical protein
LIKTVCRLAAILALALAGFAVSPLSPASAAVHQACTFGSSSGNVETCMTWNNSGTHITSIDGTADVINVGRIITICIRSDARGTIKCNAAGYIFVGPGGGIHVPWTPNATEPAGNYCVRTWRQNDDGSHTLIGEVCTVIAPN